ncbi:SURP and G-patch domain-containing protein 2-like isoform X1 [Mizuhopecten yessoensis]|uniref:SURP and G-patch domain-containing protein 2-like isoform X1 n=1 Tax=Mizuhopecten yessoensis TaxID=6573 RepID=UPI000B459569|nr:SURP and G-patch domain-containing protein 2-like isoform X1 [Mizuhopecten yessoensis]
MRKEDSPPRQPPQKMKMGDMFDLPEPEKQSVKRENEVYPPEDLHLRETIERFAVQVAENGSEFEGRTMCENVSNPSYWFLFNQSSDAYKFFRQQVKQLTRCMGRLDDGNEGDIEDVEGMEKRGEKLRKKRRSRWADSESGGDAGSSQSASSQDPSEAGPGKRNYIQIWKWM